MTTPKITGIVLAGGRSSRMGEDKSLMRLNGKTLIEYSIDALRPICEKVIISSNNPNYDFTGCEVWPDELPDQAPIIGIYSCLKRSETELNIILSCDIPLMSASMIGFLLAKSADYDITVPVHDNGQIEPLCGVYKKSSLEILKEFIESGNFRLNDCIRLASYQFIPVDAQIPCNTPNLFLNINTPSDFGYLLSEV
ncbi:MAG: molybdenum cofactor guanylyltransferase [Mariniphaga sp.]